MLTYGYWRRKFGSDRSIVGRGIRVDGKMREIIGVMPAGFHSVDQVEPSLILPFKFDRNKIWLGNFSYPAVARFKPGATVAQANAEVSGSGRTARGSHLGGENWNGIGGDSKSAA
jgi:hypothetical protein